MFRWLKMIFLPDEVQTPSIFSVHHFVPLLKRLRIFLDQLQLTLPPRGASHLQPYALLLSSRCTNQNFCHLACILHLRHIDAPIFDVLFKTLYVSVRYRTDTHMLRVFRQCGVLGCPFGTTTSTPTIVGSRPKDFPEIREGPIKPQPSPNSWPPSCGIAVSTSGVEITK